MQVLNKSREYLFLLGVLTLPIYQTLNHWFFGAFILLTFLSFFSVNHLKTDLKLIGKYFLVCGAVFFLLRLITLLYTPDIKIGLKVLTRALPFLLYPIAIISLKSQKNFDYIKFEKTMFWALTIGCLITAVICWGNVIINLESNPIPENKLFGWKKSGSFLTSILDLHPPYLGMLICGSIMFMFKEVFYNKSFGLFKQAIIYFLILFLLVFLFNITSRNTLFFILITALIFFIYKKQWKFIASILILLLISILVIVNHPSQYYRLKMYHMLGLSEKKEHEDKRFKRLEASYNVFKTNPILGVGLGKDMEMKVIEYKRMNDNIAIKKELNSHNQFFEYLAAYGIVGGFLFILAILSFIYFLIKNKYYFYLLLFLNIVFATITESIFERALGIQYYSLLISMALLKRVSNKQTIDNT